MLNFCTLFDINFIFQGLSMYKSLEAACKDDFMLYIFAFCDKSYEILNKLNLKNVKIISLNELEEGIPVLLKAKPTRTKGEYCWTCASATILYCLKTLKLEQCTYLDADLFFYSSPKALLDEMKDNSILITEHRYTPHYDQTETSGKYCVQFMSFKNTNDGLTALNWWVNSCIEWCFNRFEDGKFGDQKYLDDWTERFKGVHVLYNLGGGVAPWNVQQYKIYSKKKQLYVKDAVQNTPMVFYHFHNIKINDNLICYSGYDIDRNVLKLLYKPYTKKLIEINNSLRKNFKDIKPIKPAKPVKKPLSKVIKNLRKQIIKVKFGNKGYLEIFGKKII